MVVGLAAVGPGTASANDRNAPRSIALRLFVRLIGGDLLPCGLACCPGERRLSEVPQWRVYLHCDGPARCGTWRTSPTRSGRSPPAPALQRDGEGAFREAVGPGYRVRITVPYEGYDPPGGNGLLARRIEIAARHESTARQAPVHAESTPEARVCRAWKEAQAHPHDSNTDRSSGWHRTNDG